MKTFYVGVKGVIVRDGKVLVLHTNAQHDDRGDRWEMPGGRINADESIKQTLERELREELPNITEIKIGEIVEAHRIHKDIEADKSLVLVYYRVQAKFSGQPELSEEHTDYEWADKASIKELVQDASLSTILKAMSGEWQDA